MAELIQDGSLAQGSLMMEHDEKGRPQFVDIRTSKPNPYCKYHQWGKGFMEYVLMNVEGSHQGLRV
jgi:hypothetical protein